VFFAFTVLKAILELAFIAVTVNPDMCTPAVSLSYFPFAKIRISSNSLPKALAIFYSIDPFSIIKFAIRPKEFTSSMGFSVKIFSFKLGSLLEELPALTLLLVIHKLTLINPLVIVKHNS
jgi:hypothetical protein